MKKIILIPGNTDLNRGDQALIWESIRLIKEVYGEIDLSLIESGISKEDVLKQCNQTRGLGVNFLKPILKHPSRISSNSLNKSVHYGKLEFLFWGLQSFFDLITTLLLLSKFEMLNNIGCFFLSKDELYCFKQFKEVDAVFVKGGGFIHSYGQFTDSYQIYYSLFLVLLGIRFNKDIYILPNSIGPLKNNIAKWLVKKTLSKCRFISVRESVSKKFVESELQIKCHLFPDLGYYLPQVEFNVEEYLKSKHLFTEKKKVGITLRPYRFPHSSNPGELYSNYIDSILNFVNYIYDLEYYPLFIAHTLGPSAHENDRIALSDVIDKLPQQIQYGFIDDENLNCQEIMMLYSGLDFLVGTRFHSVVFAQNVNVPSLAISYGGNKGNGIMEDLKMSEYVIPIEEITFEKLKDSFNKLNNNTEIYKESLREIKLNYNVEKSKLKELIINCNTQ